MKDSQASAVLRNGIANAIRLFVSALVGFLLPAVLVRELAPDTYNAWLLILQIGAYLTFLDFGLQTAIAKYIAEYDALGDYSACSKIVTNATLMLLVIASFGFIALCLFSSLLQVWFPQVPTVLIPQMRWGLIWIGLATAVTLSSNALSAVFIGLQRNVVPVTLQSGTKLLVGAVTIAAALQRWTISHMAAAVATLSILGALAQIVAWRALLPRFEFHWRLRDRAIIEQLARYCGVLSIWSIAMLLISGLDTAIVGRYDFQATAYYAVAANACLFFASIISALCAPLIPAISARATSVGTSELGLLTTRTTRIIFVLIAMTMVPPIFAAYYVMKLWLGPQFATAGAPVLQVLLIANGIRLIGLPYSSIVVGLGRQWSTTLSPIVEGIGNITLSVLLAQRYGAIGVALGTLIAAVVGVALHVIVGMYYTRDILPLRRSEFALQAVIKPAVCMLPMLAFWALDRIAPPSPALATSLFLIAFTLMLVAVFSVSLSADDRSLLLRAASPLIRRRQALETAP